MNQENRWTRNFIRQWPQSKTATLINSNLVKSGFFPGNVMFSESHPTLLQCLALDAVDVPNKVEMAQVLVDAVRKSTGPSWPRPA